MSYSFDKDYLMNELRSLYHDISNNMVTTLLTLELYELPSELPIEDFDSLKKQVTSLIGKLRRSQEIIVQLADLLIVDNSPTQEFSDELM